MSIRSWLDQSRVKKGLSASLIVLSIGGLVLLRTTANAKHVSLGQSDASGAVTFAGKGAKGSFALDYSKLHRGAERRLFAQLRVKADEVESADKERAPLSLAVVLDTSGSMSGRKIQKAKRSVIELLQSMNDDDDVAFIRYESNWEMVQPLARVGEVRSSLMSRISDIRAGGGTNIPPALLAGYRALADAAEGRVRRVVLVSDGLDSTRLQSETLAREQLDKLVTTSTLGIGLDFDEGYMAGVANAGRGNFGFVRDAAALAQFLTRELDEAATTTIEATTAKLTLPRGLRFVRAIGAEGSVDGDGVLELNIGSLFAGDERRVVVQFAAGLELGETASIGGQLQWRQVGGDTTLVELSELTVTGVDSADEARSSRDGRVHASCMSALASVRQIAAAEAYANGDTARALNIIDNNNDELTAARAGAPAEADAALERQQQAYSATRNSFAGAVPSSTAGRAAAKKAAELDNGNRDRSLY